MSRRFPERDRYSITFVRKSKPVKFMKILEEKGFTVKEYEPGIYHITKAEHVDMQIIVTAQLDDSDDRYIWLKCLSEGVRYEQMETLTERVNELGESERIRAEAVLDLVIRLNYNQEWLKEENGMGEFRDLFREDFEKRDRKIEELSEQLQTKDEQLQSKDEQLQSKDKQLKDEKIKNSKLLKEIEQLKKSLNRIASY